MRLDESSGGSEFGLNVLSGIETVMPDACESRGQDVEEKSSDEFDGSEGYDGFFVAVFVVSKGERDSAVFHFDEAVI